MASYNRSIFSAGTVTYTDFDMSFKTNPVTQDIRKKTDLDSIKQSLTNLFFTNKSERPFQPGLHGGIGELLFEQLDNITIDVMEDQLRTVITNHEPRISIIALILTPKEDDHLIEIRLRFNLVNASEPQTINIILTRRR